MSRTESMSSINRDEPKSQEKLERALSKVSIGGEKNEITDNPDRPPKSEEIDPSLKKRKTTNAGRSTSSTWLSLPGLAKYQGIVKFPAEAPQRVILRLEKLMGNSTIRPVDPKYMKSLRGKLEEVEKKKWNSRIRNRKKTEYHRIRHLVINGQAAPPPGMEGIVKHPVYRVNQILNRLTNMDEKDNVQNHLKPRPIKAQEPFEDFENTGLLFGSHPNHYLKQKSERRSSSDYRKKSKKETQFIFSVPEFDGDGKLIIPPTEPDDKEEEEESAEHLEVEEEESPTPSDTGTPPKTSEAVARNIELAKKRYGINPEEIESMWKKYESPLIQMLNDSEEGASHLFDVSDDVLNTMRREELVSDKFVKTLKLNTNLQN